MVRFPTFHRLEREKACSHLTMLHFPTFHRPEREKARSHLTMVHFPTFHRPEHEKARSHLTMVHFPTFHRPEREKARSHLTIRSQHPYPLHAIRYIPCSPVPLISTSCLPDYLINFFLSMQSVPLR